MNKEILAKAKAWSENQYFSEAFRSEISDLIDKNDENQLTDRFYKDLEFGTGGLRGILGAGSNRMNIYTVRKATQGLADYLLDWSNDTGLSPKVAIAYDSRNMSDIFAREAACVFAGNRVEVHLYPQLRPVPMLSFAVRELGTTAGVVITASHNPAEYNGYKAYWTDGCQVIQPHDDGIISKVNRVTDFSMIKYLGYDEALENNMIRLIPESVEQKYFDRVESLAMGNKEHNRLFGTVYTPLHGSGNFPVSEMLKRRGFEKLTIVKSQQQPDGDFPTVDSPNPEEPSALLIAQEEAGEDDYLIIGTDPDADRLGVMVKHNGSWIKINGNQIGQLLLEYYLRKLKESGKLPADGVFVTTIVTSELGREIADRYGVQTIETLTGFKYMGAVIRELENDKSGTFLMGFEESHGYLLGDFVRDKDGVMAAMMFAELCAELHQQGKTAIDQIDRIHRDNSYHSDSLVNKVIKGQSGAMKIREIMSYLRDNPPREIAGVPVLTIRDYQKKTIADRESGEIIGQTTQPESNVLAYYMEDGSRITARPSGTEPKIKFYYNLKGEDEKTLRVARQRYEDDFGALIDGV